MTLKPQPLSNHSEPALMATINQPGDNLFYLFQGNEQEEIVSEAATAELFYMEPVSGARLKYVRI
jgi:hypothetical protein